MTEDKVLQIKYFVSPINGGGFMIYEVFSIRFENAPLTEEKREENLHEISVNEVAKNGGHPTLKK